MRYARKVAYIEKCYAEHTCSYEHPDIFKSDFKEVSVEYKWKQQQRDRCYETSKKSDLYRWKTGGCKIIGEKSYYSPEDTGGYYT